jgi:bifunctional DNase/RNase
MQVEVKIRAIMMDPNTGSPIIILKDVDSEAMLPIWVSNDTAEAIAREIEKIVPPRPLTHDLMRNFITLMGAHVERVVITELRDSTFYAVIEIQDQNGSTFKIDARPSDSIALALRVDCPIFVDEEVMRASRHTASEAAGEGTASEQEEEWPDVIGEAGDLPM